MFIRQSDEPTRNLPIKLHKPTHLLPNTAIFGDPDIKTGVLKTEKHVKQNKVNMIFGII